MKVTITKQIEYTFEVDVNADDYASYVETSDLGYIDVDSEDPAADFDHDVLMVEVHED